MKIPRVVSRLLLIVAVLVHGAALARHDVLMARSAAGMVAGLAVDAGPASLDASEAALEAALHETCRGAGGTPDRGDGSPASVAKCTLCAAAATDGPPAGGPAFAGPAAMRQTRVLARAGAPVPADETGRPPATGPPARV